MHVQVRSSVGIERYLLLCWMEAVAHCIVPELLHPCFCAGRKTGFPTTIVVYTALYNVVNRKLRQKIFRLFIHAQ